MQSTCNLGANTKAINYIQLFIEILPYFFVPYTVFLCRLHACTPSCTYAGFFIHTLSFSTLLVTLPLQVVFISLCFILLHHFARMYPPVLQFIAGASRLGKLDTSLENSVDLPANTRIPLPLWLASRIAARLPLLVEIPSTFGRQAQNELRAGSIHVNLSSRSTYFYELGLKLAIVFYSNNFSASRDILEMLQNTLAQRSFILIATRNSSGSIGKDMNVINFIQSLTELEKVIFLLKESARANYAAMRRGQSSILKTSQAVLLANQRKRKAGT